MIPMSASCSASGSGTTAQSAKTRTRSLPAAAGQHHQEERRQRPRARGEPHQVQRGPQHVRRGPHRAAHEAVRQPQPHAAGRLEERIARVALEVGAAQPVAARRAQLGRGARDLGGLTRLDGLDAAEPHARPARRLLQLRLRAHHADLGERSRASFSAARTTRSSSASASSSRCGLSRAVRRMRSRIALTRASAPWSAPDSASPRRPAAGSAPPPAAGVPAGAPPPAAAPGPSRRPPGARPP